MSRLSASRRTAGRQRRLRSALALLGCCLAAVVAGRAAEPVAAGAFEVWVDELRQEALGRRVSPQTLDRALADLRPIERVLELDRHQPETTLTFAQYLNRVVPDERVGAGRARLARHRELLERIRSRYGVQPRFLVALWGIESDFGRRIGNFSVVGALATLAYDGRRSEFFRGELLDALVILEEGHVDAKGMLGSWAGAMGQPQFMPSSFRSYAVDFDGDSRRDIWQSVDDVLASAANYLARSGWNGEETWGRRVRLPNGFDADRVGRDVRKPIAEWQALGVRRANGADLPRADISGSLVQPGGPGGPTYLVYDNYRVLLRWNRSDYFATAVGILADRIRAGH